MIKLLPAAFFVLLFLSAAPLRAQEDGDDTTPEAGASSGNEAASAARDKGYRAEGAAQATTGAEGGAPSASPVPGGSLASPPSHQADAPARAAASTAPSGSGAATAAAGISCEKGVPKLTAVHKREIDFFDKINRGNVIRFAMGPNEAASWHFKTPASGSGLIEEDMGTFAMPTPTMLTISETPCDFDMAKAKSKTKENIWTTACYQLNPNGGSVAFQIAPAKEMGYGCVLKPNTDYYFNVRALASDGHDPCMDVGFGMKKWCGGIWAAHGNFKWKDAEAERKKVDFKVNDSAHIGWQP